MPSGVSQQVSGGEGSAKVMCTACVGSSRRKTCCTCIIWALNGTVGVAMHTHTLC